MSPIRIHLGQMPSLLRAMINDLLSEDADFVVVGCSARGDDPLAADNEQHADVVITNEGSDSGSTCLDAIIRQSPLSIFAISADGKGATAVNIVRSSIALDAVERGTLADAIRRVAIYAGEADRAALP